MRTLDELIDFYENLDACTDVERFDATSTRADAWFKDPFNEVRGIDAIQRIFRHMFKQLETPRFHVCQRIVDAAAMWC